jgi:HSP20 family protein
MGVNNPITGVFEMEDQFVVQVALPGIEKDDIAVMLDERGVHIQAQQEQFAKESMQNGVFASDTIFTGFARYIPLPVCADTNNAQAVFTEDVLFIHVPKREDARRRQLAPE